MVDAKDVVRAINKNGKQGPNNLKDKAVYQRIKNKIGLSYEAYLALILKNSIVEAQRKDHREAYFIENVDHSIHLFKTNEEEIRNNLCYIIGENPGQTSSEIIKRFKILYHGYTSVDMMDQMNLTSKQDIIDQTIRNVLVSNRKKQKNKNLFKITDEKPFKFYLTEQGKEIALLAKHELMKAEQIINEYVAINEIKESRAIAEGLSGYTETELAEIKKENKEFDITKKKMVESSQEYYVTDARLKKTRIAIVNDQCEINTAHITFPTNKMKNFVEGHHVIPMALQKKFSCVNLDCVENLIALCPNCHAQIHYGTLESRRELFEKILSIKKEELYIIGFEDQHIKLIFESYYK